MNNIFFIGDTHFGHKNIIKFLREDGTKVRPFDSVKEMDDHIISKRNKTVSNNDTVYHLGDVVMNRNFLPILNELNGNKILILGNHDKFKMSEYLLYFNKIYSSHKLYRYILTHIPIHPFSINNMFNIHGHIHEKRVMLNSEIDPKYICVSVENINYTPISIDDIKNI